MAGRKQTATMELAIGATIIAAIIILVVMLMSWGNATSFLGRHYRVAVDMANVGGLKEGAPVKLGGYQIGRVASIQLPPGSVDLEIVLDIDESRLLPRGSMAKVSTAGLVGDAFMEIIPGKSKERIKRAATAADAERLDASPLPDITELMTKVDIFGEQLISLSQSLNDIFGNEEFRRNVKDLAFNVNAASQQANLILQRGQTVVGSIDSAAQNVATLTAALKGSVEKMTANLTETTEKIKAIAEKATSTLENVDSGVTDARATVKEISGDVRVAVNRLSDDLHRTVGAMAEDARKSIGNLNGGISDIRSAVGKTLGDPENQANLAATVRNINAISDALAARRQALDTLLENLSDLSGNLKASGEKVRRITDRIEPESVASALSSMTGAINSLSDVVEKIKAEPVLALSVNKAADRIVKMKFDELSRQPQFRSADATLDEINRWIRDSLRRGAMDDPAHPFHRRPYALDK